MDTFSKAWKDAMQFPGDHYIGTRVTVALEHVRRVNDQISKDNKRKARALYADQFKAVEDAKANLQLDWSNLDSLVQLYAAQTALEDQRLQKLEVTENALAAKWIQIGDRCSKEFFEFHKYRKAKTIIFELMDSRRSLTDEANIINYIQSYYVSLYTNDIIFNNNLQAREKFLSSVPLPGDASYE